MSEAFSEVKLIANKPHDEMLKLYEDIYAIVVPSREESLSMVAIECMMMKRPCLVSDNVGVASAMQERGAGLIFRSGEPEELVEKMRFLINNPSQAESMGARGRNVYESLFTAEKFAERLLRGMAVCMEDKL